MPRVSIEKLKEGLGVEQREDVETTAKQTSHTNTWFATLITKVKRNRQQKEKPGWEDSASDSVQEDEMLLGETHFTETAPTSDKEKENNEAQAKKRMEKQDNLLKGGRKPHHLNINENVIKRMKDVEQMLQKANKGKKLRVVVVESDEEDDDAGCSNVGNNDLKLNVEGEFVVQAEVHHARRGKEAEQSIETGCENINEENVSLAAITLESENNGGFDTGMGEMFRKMEKNNTGGAKPKQRKTDSGEAVGKAQNVRQKASGRKKSGDTMRRRHLRNEDEKKSMKYDVQWGLDESSESESERDWYMDGGNIPLLPR